MKNLLLLFLTLSSGLATYAQHDTVFIRAAQNPFSDNLNYSTDTLLFDSQLNRHILIGTCIIPASANNMSLLNFGYRFVEVQKSECSKNSGEEVYRAKDHINSIEVSDSTLSIDFNVYDNCCYDFLCDASIDSSGVLNLHYQGYGTFCSCHCCFGLKFIFRKEIDKENFKIKAVLLNDDSKTLKQLP